VVSHIDQARSWLRARDPLEVVDVVLAMLFLGFGLASVWAQDLVDGQRQPNGLAVVLVILATTPVAFRRRAPLSAVAVHCVAICWLVFAGFPEGILPFVAMLLTYTVAASSTLRRAIAGLAVVCTSVAALRVGNAPDFDGLAAGFNAAFLSIAWGAGLAVRARREAVEATLREAEERANVEQQRAARMIAEERLRIAQELHDVVAHSMSVIAVQAGVGAHVVDHRPDQAKTALEAISGTARSTLAEMRRLLGVLRDDDGNRSHAPAPKLSDLAQLVDDVRSAGIPVSLDVVGEPQHFSAAVELSAYRIVQEALTNVIKHAGPLTQVTVRLTHTADDITVEVVDDGRGAAARNDDGLGGDVEPPGGGHGLLGMRERVDIWGGTLDVGPVVGGGYRVGATLPTAVAT
jgi:signal transduction histidine kinase